MKKFGNILWGIVLIVLGLIIALNALGITSINIFFDGWWTLIIIIPSFIGLFKNTNKMWSFIWLVVGIVLLLCSQRVLSFAIIGKLIFPFILIMIGISIIFKDFFDKKISEKIRNLNATKEGKEEYCATFGAQEANYQGKEFEGASLDAIFGSVEFDLTGAIVKKDQVINASAIFGGIEIIVPANVNVKVKSTPLFGGTSNKVKAEFNENLPTIYINSYAIFGGVEIK